MSALGGIGGRLYRGEVSVEFVGRQRLWYTISGVILAVSIIALAVFGLNFSVDFKGGSVFQFPAGTATISQVRTPVSAAGGGGDAIVQQVANPQKHSASWTVQTHQLTPAQRNGVEDAIARTFHLTPDQISVQYVGASWGSQISKKALQALIAFLVVIVIYLSIAFEWKMAASALIALAHDIVITVGVYALLGFQVSPASVIGLLTILGYSLYDTVVVFDKVRENTAGLLGSARATYSQAANQALNQTLVRSINTSVIALLPVAAILFIGAGLLGAGELKDLALVLFVGMLSGTYSSICIATPVLADLKEREPQYKALAKRVSQRAASGRAAKREAARAGARNGTAGGRGTGERSGRRRPGRGTRPGRRRGGRRRGRRRRRGGRSRPRGPDLLARGHPRRAAARPASAAAAHQRGQAPSQRQEEAAVAPVPGEETAADSALAGLIKARVRDVADYPQPGVVFKDITPLLADGQALAAVVSALAEGHGPVDKVAGIEARGFILAASVACQLGSGFVPVRKQGRLPGPTYARSYQLEYGTATIEVHQDAFTPGERVLIVDDVLATGGTAEATTDLVRRAGAEVAGIAVILELSFLGGRGRLAEQNLRSLLVV